MGFPDMGSHDSNLNPIFSKRVTNISLCAIGSDFAPS